MSAYPLYEELGDRIEGQLARLCDKNVTAPHEQVGAVYRLEYVLVPENMNTFLVLRECLLTELLCPVPVVEMRLGKRSHLWDPAEQFIPHVPVVAHIDIQHGLLFPDLRKQFLYDRSEYLSLCAGSADGQKKPHRLSFFLS